MRSIILKYEGEEYKPSPEKDRVERTGGGSSSKWFTVKLQRTLHRTITTEVEIRATSEDQAVQDACLKAQRNPYLYDWDLQSQYEDDDECRPY